MTISDDYILYVAHQLKSLGNLTVKKMFGGAGIYFENVFFALIADDVLYFKVDETNRKHYEKKAMGPFKPFDDKPYTMQYYEVPVDILEDSEELYKWAMVSFNIGKIKKNKKPAKKKAKTRKKKRYKE
ncbi:MAG: TfoX/Sxy family protein [Candidatus Aureabacteria bacterium]|nr:TfoX/Sxy family protein [Candidatus Auribacterota bacterium]